MVIDRLKVALFYTLGIDLLVFPYFPFFAITLFFWLLFVYLLMEKKIYFRRNDIFCFLIFIFFAIVSTCYSYLFDNNAELFFSENLKRLLQLVLFFIYYFCFYNFFYKYKDISQKYMERMVACFFYAVFLFVLLYFIDFNSFLYFKSIFNANDGFITMFEDGSNEIYRFSYIWTDPNNIAYAILGTYLFSILVLKLEPFKQILYFFIVLSVCLASMSTTAWLILLSVVIPTTIVMNYKNVFLYLLFILFVILGIDSLINTVAFENAWNRFQDNSVNSESGQSRLVIWSKVVSIYVDELLRYLFIGQGYQLHDSNVPIKPHNGVLLILFGYGFVALLSFIYLFFGVKIDRKSIFVIPFFLCFFINVMIGELKLVLWYLMMLAYVRALSLSDKL